MLEEITKLDPAIRFQYRQVARQCPPEASCLLGRLEGYLGEYADQGGMSPRAVLDRYLTFVDGYIRDLRRFQDTGLYPFETDGPQPHIDRVTYDIFLILSTLITRHRFSLMKALYETPVDPESSLIVGVGSGLELLLIENRCRRIDAHDLSLSSFCRSRFGHVNLREGDFRATSLAEQYGTAYAIELLEHFRVPYAILDALRQTVRVGGRVVATTATNVPQFDHLYNFVDTGEFEREVSRLGMVILQKLVVPHQYMFHDVDASNTFYVLERRA